MASLLRTSTPNAARLLLRATPRVVDVPLSQGITHLQPRARSIQTSAVLFSSPTPSSQDHASTTSNNDPTLNTVNQSEVSHFDALASTWWDSHGPSRLLHLMNPLRHDFIASCHASEPPPPPPTDGSSPQPSQPRQGLHYLDVGCGGGIFAESAARLPTAASVTAIDASSQVLAVARAHLRRETPAVQAKLTYLHSSVEALSDASAAKQQQQQYDVVTTFEVLEHVDNPSAFLQRCGALVRPGGWLVLSTMARTWTSWATTILAAEHVLGIVPPGTHDWQKYVDVEELRAHFASRPASEGWTGNGSVERCQGVVYVPGLGWKAVPGSEKVGNYFYAVRKSPYVPA
ncbi:uncharacterized protein PgNI_08196 [Pyricularia grisea]|uniref:Ubiquinone biosynthesis O-methyltransferase, mitochondrial n=1 Tax=Pyricularia grisea TaxID=148305 RepID=A0A6P8AX50_PYRGI|nr:uncharacterized protein PgNI_08196 [Pyricularia grisea]TLD06739.1 hypothetical protein PgNI_08196 [Pyricularia grisea]